MTLGQLQSQVENINNVLIMNLASVGMMQDKKTRKWMRNKTIELSVSGVKGEVDLDPLYKALGDPSNCDMFINEFIKSGFRATLRDLLYSVKSYYSTTEQMEMLESTDWYWMLSLMVNATISNGYCLFTDTIKKRLPIEWHGVRIDQSMDGKPMTMDIFGHHHLLTLINTVLSWIRQQA